MCQNIQLFVSNIFKNVILLNMTFYLEKRVTQMLQYHKKYFSFKKTLFLAFFQTYVLTCQLQLLLYDAPAYQNVTNEMRKSCNCARTMA